MWISLLLFTLLASNCEELWEKKGYILRMPKTLYINVGMFYSKEALEKAKDKPDYYNRVLLKTSQIFSWHNIVYKVIYEERWTTDKIKIYETSNSVTPNTMLNDMFEYSRNLEIIDMHLSTLITDHSSTSRTIGLAYIKEINVFCSAYTLGGSHGGFNEWTNAQVIAHETGHCLGLKDSSEGLCIGSNGFCIMNPSSKYWSFKYPPAFSSKSMEDLMKFNFAGFSYPGKAYKSLITTCGNGVLEEGEECDCGFEASCKLRGAINCCNYTTCKLIGKSKCSDGPCCKECQFVSGVPCREKNDTKCDYIEYCTGNSETCPPDDYKPDGTPCGDNTYCVNGMCASTEQKCAAMTTYNKEIKDTCRFSFFEKYNDQTCKYSSEKYCQEKNKWCSFVMCENKYDIFNQGECVYYSIFFANLAARNTDGLSCGSKNVCLAGECVDSDENIKLCASVRCVPSMSCRMGKCYRFGAKNTVCENVACGPNEVCTYHGKCHIYESLPADKHEHEHEKTELFYVLCYVIYTLILITVAIVGIIIKEFVLAK